LGNNLITEPNKVFRQVLFALQSWKLSWAPSWCILCLVKCYLLPIFSSFVPWCVYILTD